MYMGRWAKRRWAHAQNAIIRGLYDIVMYMGRWAKRRWAHAQNAIIQYARVLDKGSWIQDPGSQCDAVSFTGRWRNAAGLVHTTTSYYK
jgi:hypothetical protein